MVHFTDLPVEIHMKIAAQLIVGGCYPSHLRRDHEMVLPLARTSSYWNKIVLVAFKQARQEIEVGIDLLVARSAAVKKGDNDGAAFVRWILRRAMNDTLRELRRKVQAEQQV